MTGDLWKLSAVEQAEGIRQRKFSATDAVNASLARMNETNAAVNAITIDMSEQARGAAEAADRAVEAGGDLGPLHGVPITIKENIDVKGEPTTMGVAAFENNIAPDHSPVTKNLLDAGAILIGRTNTPEFGLRWLTENPLRGDTANPWDLARSPGGSSGGAAASVMLGMGAVAHGNDLGGSVRYPAYCCGAVGIRPTQGRVPNFNPSAMAARPIMIQLMAVQGPLTRTVADTRLALKVMSRRDPRDPWWVPAPLEGPAVDQPVKVAVPRDLGATVHPSVNRGIETAAAALSDAGYAVETVETPSLDELRQIWGETLFTDVRLLMEQAVKDYGSDDVNAALAFRSALFEEPDFQAYAAAFGKRETILREWVMMQEDYPILLTPVSLEPPLLPREDCVSESRYCEVALAQSWLVAFNFLGLPSVSVPTGLFDGLPTGVQLVGQRFREDLCLDAAQVVEDSVGIMAETLWKQFDAT